MEYEMVREPDNPFDLNAIRVCAGPHKFGYIPAMIAQNIAPEMDSGRRFIAQYVSLNKSPYYDKVGLTIRIVEVDEDYRFSWQQGFMGGFFPE